MAKAPFFFREDKNQVFYHDFKIFIFGTDVTPWITNQVSMVRADRDGINSLSFSLSNAYRAFELTGDNLGIDDPNTYYDDLGNAKVKNSGGSSSRAGKFRLTDPYSINGRYSELAKAKIFTLKKQQNGTSRNVKWKVKSLGPVTGGTGAKIRSIKNEDSNNATDVTTDRYPMCLGSLVFHKYDPVRLFVKNPLTRSEDEWVCEFTGYLDTKPFSQNYTTGESIVNITCQDIRLLMQHMRVQTNPMAQVSNENLAFFGAKGSPYAAQDPIPLTSGLFADFITHGDKGVTHVLGGKNWLESVKFLFFGVPTGSGGRRGAVGKLKEGLTYNYSASDSKKSDMLEKWNNIINFGVTPIAVKDDVAPLVPEGAEDADPSKFELLPSSASKGNIQPGTYLTRAQMYALGTATIPDGAGSPDACKVHFLLPAEGTPTHNMITYGIGDSGAKVDQRVEFSSRLELLSQLMKSCDYQMYVTGSGDFVVEFPMYDFQPTDYNDAYNGLYTFYNHILSDNINDEQSSGLSALEVTSRQIFKPLQNEAENPSKVGTDIELRETVFSSVLASRIGAIIETYDVPGVTDRVGLIQLAYVEFNKRLANFSLFDMNVAYRPYITVNRPIFHVRKQRFGITKSVTYTWRIHEEASLEMSLQYTRRREGDTFRFITGGERQPISYRTIYSGAKIAGHGVDDSATGNKDVPSIPKNENPTNTKNDEGNIQR